jgi:hypothetical protein
MFVTGTMKNARNANDNKDPWISLSAATERALDSNKKKDSERGDEADPSDEDKQKQERQRAYVDQRLKELAAFEERARGIRRRP